MITGSSTTAQLKNLELLAKLMDSRFKIPGTNIRFGLDALIGLVPLVGDLSTFMISGFMVMIMARNGASGFVVARMILNIVIDALFGSIPIIGDVFDVAFKANQLNIKLMREHYVKGRHKGSAWKLIIPILMILLMLIAAVVWISFKLFNWLFY